MAASGALHGESRLDVLDGLRGVAVLLVLWYHIWEISWLPAPVSWLQFIPETGFIGVHLFFFLSGFVIVYPFVRAAVTGRAQPTWAHFALRRFIKIFPSYALSIIVAFAIGYAQTQYSSDWFAVITHLLFIHTWFPSSYGAINGVLWTLAVEVEFYCLFPLIWWCFKRSPYLTAATMIAIAWAWRVLLVHCCYGLQFAEWAENLPGYLDIFAFGMLSAYLFTRYAHGLRAAVSRIAGPAVSIVGVVLLIALLQGLFAYRIDHEYWQTVWQIDRRPLFGLAFTAIALGWLVSPVWWQFLLANPVLKFFAVISYNLYLYHQIVAREILSLHLIPVVGDDPHYDPTWQVRYTIAAFASTIAEAAIVTYLFERPLQRIDPPGLRPARSGHSPVREPARSDGRDGNRRNRNRRDPRSGR
jgi:peptidoglycan/LPS O-acetylase OafA/YrhL